MLPLWANYKNCYYWRSLPLLASVDGPNISITQNGRNLQDRVPIGAPRMGVPSAARDILSILHPTWHSYIYGGVYTIDRYHKIPMDLYGLHISACTTASYSLMTMVYTPTLGPLSLSLLYVYFTSYYTSNVYGRSRVRGILHFLLICSFMYYSLLRHHI
jgi:hypothetical protein